MYGIEIQDEGAQGIVNLIKNTKKIHTLILGNTDISPIVGKRILTEASRSSILQELRWGNLQDIPSVEKIQTKFNQVIIFEHFRYKVARTPLYFDLPYYEIMTDLLKF